MEPGANRKISSIDAVYIQNADVRDFFAFFLFLKDNALKYFKL